MGVRGAAWATAVAQILGALALLYTLRAVSKVSSCKHRTCPCHVTSEEFMERCACS